MDYNIEKCRDSSKKDPRKIILRYGPLDRDRTTRIRSGRGERAQLPKKKAGTVAAMNGGEKLTGAHESPFGEPRARG